MQDAAELVSIFKEIFGGMPELVAFAPGRVNLIGEHTDYNGGHVMPCALDMGTLCAARKREDGKLRLCSLNMPQRVYEADLNDLSPLTEGGWTAYPAGTARAQLDEGFELCGADMLFRGDIPSGAGLSSSAAMEVTTGLTLLSLIGVEPDPVRLALLCQRAENRYVGVNCGIMDQFASAMGKRDSAIFLNTNTLEYEYAPCALEGAKLVIVNSNYKHSLAASEYNTRRAECEKALAALKAGLDIRALCELGPEEFEANKQLIGDPVLIKRAKHAVYENARTLAALSALKNGNIPELGRLMNESHISLRDDYEVSCGALDTLTELAWECPGVIGARMTGGGFGGSMISIVKEESIEEFTSRVGGGYFMRTGLTADIFTAGPAEGARIVWVNQ